MLHDVFKRRHIWLHGATVLRQEEKGGDVGERRVRLGDNVRRGDYAAIAPLTGNAQCVKRYKSRAPLQYDVHGS
jgi:hypothetical protein